MKMHANSVLKQISTDEIGKLTSMVKERIAADIKPRRIKKFTAVDLWNIRRKLKRARLQF